MYTAPPVNALAKRSRPSLLWLALPVAAILSGALWMIFGFIGLNNQVNSLQRVPFPGQGEITLPHGGGYVVYYEGPGASDGHVPSGDINVRHLTPGAEAKAIAPVLGQGHLPPRGSLRRGDRHLDGFRAGQVPRRDDRAERPGGK